MAYDAPGGTGANLKVSTWDETIQTGIYDRSQLLQRTVDYGKGMAQKTIRKIAAMTGAVVADTSDGTDMTFTSMNPTTSVLTPYWYFAGHQYPDTLPWTAGDSVSRVAADDAEAALAATLEAAFLVDAASLTSYIGTGAYNIDTPGFRSAIASLGNTGKVAAEPGVSDIYMLLGALQQDDAMSIPELTHADQRGDGQNPLVSGRIAKGSGVNFMFSTLAYNDGSAVHGLMWVKEAFGHFFNKRAGGEKQRYKKTTYVMADAHFAHNIIHQSRAIGIRHSAA